MPKQKTDDAKPAMTGEEYDRALDKIGFSNRGFCLDVARIDDSSGRKWKKQGPPGSVAALLRLCLALKLDAPKIRKLLKIE